jgi:hypothetical protein
MGKYAYLIIENNAKNYVTAPSLLQLETLHAIT